MFWVLAAFGCLLVDRDRARAAAGRPGLGRRGRRCRFGPGARHPAAGGWPPAVCLGPGVRDEVVGPVLPRRVRRDDRALGPRARGARPASAAVAGRGCSLRDGAAVRLDRAGRGRSPTSRRGPAGSRSERRLRTGTGPPTTRRRARLVARTRCGRLWHYHRHATSFHIGLASHHPYESNPWSWLVLGPADRRSSTRARAGRTAATVEQCSRGDHLARQPGHLVGGGIAIAVVLSAWLLRRDWRAGAILGRPARRATCRGSSTRSAPSSPSTRWRSCRYVVLALTYVLGLVLGPGARCVARGDGSGGPRPRRPTSCSRC